MSKSLKPIIITLAIILVIAIAMVLLVFVFPNDTDAAAEETAEPTETVSKTVKMITEDDEALVSFEIIPTDGESMLVEINRDSDGALSYTVTPQAEYFSYDTTKFRSMMYTLTSVSATNFVEEDAEDLARYGLDAPWFTVRSTYDDGHVVDIYLGNATPTDSNYYVCTNLSNDVYTLGTYMVSLLTRTDIDYRDITLFPTYEDDDIYENISYVRLTDRDGSEVELSLEDTENYSEGNTTKSLYYMTIPTQTSCNDYTVKAYVMDVVAQLASYGVLRDITEDEYAEYGFDRAAELEMEDISGNHVDILIGGKQDDYYYYVMLKDSPGTVILAGAEAFEWLGFNYIELMNRTAWFVNITDIASIEYSINGEEYYVEMTHGTETDEDGNTSSTLDATLNGDAISEKNCRRLFVRTLNFRIMGDVTDETSVSGKPSCTIKMNLLDGSEMLMELYEINNRQYALAVNGEMDYYIYKKNVTTLESAFETILSGGELPMSYDA
jgi:hypothetical protein